MKTFLLLISISVHAQTDKIPLKPSLWDFNSEKVRFSNDSLFIGTESGPVILKDCKFSSGTIEFDMQPLTPEFSQSIYFRRQNEAEQEVVYFRTKKLENPFASDAIQYSPYIDGVNLWDLYDEYQASAMLKPNQWNHIKIVVSGNTFSIYLNHSEKASLRVPQLEARSKSGTLAFEGASVLANLHIRHEKVSDQQTIDLSDHDPKYIRQWQVSSPLDLPPGNEPITTLLPDSSTFSGSIAAERKGMINLTRKFGKNKSRNIIWLKADIIGTEAANKILQLGFSDDIWVYLNRQLVHTDKNPYWESIAMRKYPNGRISIWNTAASLNLNKGKNELIIGVANDFFGWGLIAKFVNTDGISF